MQQHDSTDKTFKRLLQDTFWNIIYLKKKTQKQKKQTFLTLLPNHSDEVFKTVKKLKWIQ